MGYIYKVTNTINGKVYIGQTYRDVPTRWHEHIYHSYNPNRGYNSILHSAIRKYGEDAFVVEIVEECETERLEERETFWIKEFGSAYGGYNSSLGGAGWHKCSDEELLYWWGTGRSLVEMAEYVPLHPETISKHLRRLGVSHQEIKDRGNEKARHKKEKPVYQYGLDGKFIRGFPSLADAQQSIGGMRIKFSPNTRMKSFCGYQWRKYKVDNIGAVSEKSRRCQRTKVDDFQ